MNSIQRYLLVLFRVVVVINPIVKNRLEMATCADDVQYVPAAVSMSTLWTAIFLAAAGKACKTLCVQQGQRWGSEGRNPIAIWKSFHAGMIYEKAGCRHAPRRRDSKSRCRKEYSASRKVPPVAQNPTNPSALTAKVIVPAIHSQIPPCPTSRLRIFRLL
jgi:hypothetical protein